MVLSVEQLESRCDSGVSDLPVILNTKQAAAALGRSAGTLRKWSSTGEGPIAPCHIGGRLGWHLDKIRALLAGDAANAPR